MFDYDATSTDLVLVGSQGDLLSLVAAGRFVGVVVARANSDEEDTKGTDERGENGETCLDRGPNPDGRTKPRLNLCQELFLCFWRLVTLTGEILDPGNVDQFRGLDECSNDRARVLSLRKYINQRFNQLT